jgi:hypothetical protein
VFLKRRLTMVNEIVWDRRVPSMGGTVRRYTSVHDNIGYFAVSKDYFFDLDPIRIPYDAVTKKARSRKLFEGSKWLELGYNPKDVWSVSRLHRQHAERVDHPTQKPLEIIERMVSGQLSARRPRAGSVHGQRHDRSCVCAAWARIHRIRNQRRLSRDCASASRGDAVPVGRAGSNRQCRKPVVDAAVDRTPLNHLPKSLLKNAKSARRRRAEEIHHVAHQKHICGTGRAGQERFDPVHHGRRSESRANRRIHARARQGRSGCHRTGRAFFRSNGRRSRDPALVGTRVGQGRLAEARTCRRETLPRDQRPLRRSS